MKFQPLPNILLEGLTYFGRKASKNTWDIIDNKINNRNIETSLSFQQTFSKLKEFTCKLDETISISEDKLSELFGNIEGFAFNTIGTSSIAFLLFYGVLEEYNGDFHELLKIINTMSQDRMAYNIASALDLSENFKSNMSMTNSEFMDGVLSLSIPAESKIKIFDTYHNYKKYIDEISTYLKDIINVLQININVLNDITRQFENNLIEVGCNTLLKQISHYIPVDGVKYNFQPFILGMDTLLVSDQKFNTANIYCGILRKEILEMLNTQESYVDNVYEAYHLLGDRTRFDILCYLRNNSAYGQELSKHFNLSRNTIHHHISKLINAGLLSSTTDGNRVYYSLNNDTFEDFMLKQKDVFSPLSTE